MRTISITGQTQVGTMNNKLEQQWGKREGYAGPGSFPKEVMGYVREKSDALAGQEHFLYLSDGRVLHYKFKDKDLLSMKPLEGGHGFEVDEVSYRAFEGAPGIFIVSHTYPGNAYLNTSLVLDLNRNQVIVVDGEIPNEGDDDYRVRETFVTESVCLSPSTWSRKSIRAPDIGL